LAQWHHVFRSVIVMIAVVMVDSNDKILTTNDALFLVKPPTRNVVFGVVLVVRVLRTGTKVCVGTLAGARCLLITVIDGRLKNVVTYWTLP